MKAPSAVTMPHKLAILPHLDELTPEAAAVGACNTITVIRRTDADGGPWFVGTNTDVIGIRESFYRNVTHPAEVRAHLPLHPPRRIKELQRTCLAC